VHEGAKRECHLHSRVSDLINQGSGDYYDILVGQGFVQRWDQWQGGDSKTQREAIIDVIADIKNIFGFKDLTVTATPSTDTLTLVVDGRSERIRELGAGLSQFIIVLGNVAIKRPELLVIDEPELNLHPALQLKFLAALSKYTRHIVFATHSLGLARTAEHVYSVKREDSRSVIRSLPATRSYAELLGEMSFESYREIGFDQLLCVEGVTDILFMQVFLRKLGLDHRIVVFPLAGETLITSNREQELSELKRISERVAVLIDSEKDKEDADLSDKRKALKKTCENLGFNVHVTEWRATENYLLDAAIKQEMGPSYRALNPYEDFKKLKPSWSKGENWKIAQHMTKEQILASDVGQWLSKL
jgi:energy-coupling factor transporter ATP-binding protein EcfA2